jgi:glutathione synthase/RimK-type ligase-like ATP-grasp enzyme
MILIIGWNADPHVATVTQLLDEMGQSFALLDAYGKRPHGIHHLLSSGVSLDIGNVNAQLREVTAIWFRQKPRFVVPTDSIFSLYDYYFVHREWNHIIDFIADECSHVPAINNRVNAGRAENKLVQLNLAVENGFAIPPTLVSNQPEAILDFVAKADKDKCIFKTLNPYMPPNGTVTFTTVVDIHSLQAKKDELAVAPGIFQMFIKKQFELRIIVAGDDIFAARINSHHSSRTEVDWRQDQFSEIYTEFELDSEFANKLRLLHRSFGLFFAVYDFVVDEDGEPVFLEVNPSGQWMYIEYALRFPVSDRLANALANPSLI